MSTSKASIVKTETQRESIINRPYNLAGSIRHVSKERFSITPTKISLTQSNTIPALMKLFMESLDNPIDMAIKKACTKIDIKVTSTTISTEDDGAGVSSVIDDEGISNVFRAFCIYNSGSNYDDNKGKGQKGTNGIGIKLCTTLSTHMKVVSDDGIRQVTVVATQNNLKHKITEKPTTKSTGVKIEFKPDFSIIKDATEIDQEHIDRMFEYTLIQSLTYPEVTFRFNGKIVKYTPRKLTSLLGDTVLLEQGKEFFFALTPNDLDDFRQISYVNGLEISRGGTHVDYIMDRVVKGIREKLVKKYKTIKPADIKNKLMFVMIGRNMQHIDWEGQVKDSINSDTKDMLEYYGDIDFGKIVTRVMKTPELIDPITEIYKMKEELKRRKEMSGLTKKKKIKTEKYLPATGVKKYLMITEGASATGGLMPVLGRDNVGYYELKGKPLNVMSATHADFLKNVELSELYQIVLSEGYEFIIPSTDQDLDGFHIRGLLFGFIHKYLPETKTRIGIMNTPVIGIKKAKKLTKWYYSLKDDIKVNAGETSKYYKGLGSWKESDLKHIVEKDGLAKMIEPIEFDSDDILDDWLLKKTVQKRKEYIQANEFDIAKL